MLHNLRKEELKTGLTINVPKTKILTEERPKFVLKLSKDEIEIVEGDDIPRTNN